MNGKTGKQTMVEFLDKQLGSYEQQSRSNSNIQRLGDQPTRNQQVSSGTPRLVETRSKNQQRGKNIGNKGQSRGQVISGLRSRNRKISLGQQGRGNGGFRTNIGYGLNDPVKPENKPKQRPKKKNRKRNRKYRNGKAKRKLNKVGEFIPAAFATKNFRTRSVKKSMYGNKCRLTGSELLVTLNPDTAQRNVEGAVFFQQPLNPLTILSTRLGQEAKMWQKFRINNIRFYFSSAAGSTATGQIGFGVCIDPTVTWHDLGLGNLRKYVDLPFHKETNLWNSTLVEFKKQTPKWYDLLLEEGTRFFSEGTFVVINFTAIQAAVVLGKLIIDYDIEFKDQIINNNLLPLEPSFTTSLVNNSLNFVAGEPFRMSPLNFSIAPDPDTIYQVILVNDIHIGGSAILLGLDSDNWPSTAGHIMYMKRKSGTSSGGITDGNYWYFYDFMPDSDPTGTDDCIPITAAVASAAFSGTLALIPEGFIDA